MVEKKHTFIVVGILLAIILTGGGATQVSGQADSQDLVMSNMSITATMDSECTTSLIIGSEVTNVGSTILDYFDLRIDVRSFNVASASLNGSTASIGSIKNNS